VQRETWSTRALSLFYGITSGVIVVASSNHKPSYTFVILGTINRRNDRQVNEFVSPFVRSTRTVIHLDLEAFTLLNETPCCLNMETLFPLRTRWRLVYRGNVRIINRTSYNAWCYVLCEESRVRSSGPRRRRWEMFRGDNPELIYVLRKQLVNYLLQLWRLRWCNTYKEWRMCKHIIETPTAFYYSDNNDRILFPHIDISL